MDDAESAKLLFTEGLKFLDSRDFPNAEQRFLGTLQLRPQSIPTLSNLAFALSQQGKLTEARQCAERAVAINGSDVNALMLLANCLAGEKKFAEALAACDRIIAIETNIAEAHCNRGFALKELHRYGDALASYEQAIKLQPRFITAHLNRGATLNRLSRFGAALAAYDQTLALQPNQPEAVIGRANALFGLGRYDEALKAYDLALQIPADHAKAWLGRGNVFLVLYRYEEAFHSFDKAYQIEPSAKLAEARLYSKMHLCDWTNFEAERAHLLAEVRSGAHAAQPLGFLSLSSSAADQLQCALLAVENGPPGLGSDSSASAEVPKRRIRVAYLSADMHDHAVAFLMAGVFEQHDRSQFETFVVSYGPERAGEMRTRLKGAVEHFFDVRLQSDEEVVARLRGLAIDIVVDLSGHTAEARPGIAAARPARVQVNYLGYPGTSGAPYIDYMLADRFTIPESAQQHYSEKIVYLPDSFQANDDKRPIPPLTSSRAAAGLPERGFVFCSFNSNAKLAPDVFTVWMRLLQQTEGSVLWVLASNPTAERNLRREAVARGIAPERIILAPRVGYLDYLTRYPLADLFLDSWPFNAGTTASDALWMGLPVLTCTGDAFASRMAGSLLHSLALPELVTQSLTNYEMLALQLAHDPVRLVTIKDGLAYGRKNSTVFNTRRFTRHLESAYRSMYERHWRGEPCASFAVAPVDGRI